MSVMAEQVWTALEGVSDPELGMSIVELGLVYGMDIRHDAVRITMTLTTPGCPLHDSMTNWVRQAIMRVPGVAAVDVQLVFDPPWSAERMNARPRGAPFLR